MGTLVDVIHQIVHDESFGSLHLSIFVLPSFARSYVYDSSPISLHGRGQRYRLERINIDLDVLVLQSFTADNCVDVEV